MYISSDSENVMFVNINLDNVTVLFVIWGIAQNLATSHLIKQQEHIKQTLVSAFKSSNIVTTLVISLEKARNSTW